MRSLLPLSLLSLCALSPGCDEDRFLSGRWFTVDIEEPLAEQIADGLGCPPEGVDDVGNEVPCRIWIELAMGQFGADVAGVIRLYRDENRVFETPCEQCPPQRFQGRYVAETLSFRFQDCNGRSVQAELRGGGSPMTGTFDWANETSNAAPLELIFEKVEDEDQITAEEKRPSCSGANEGDQ